MEVISYKLDDLEYRTPITFIDDNGELVITYLDDPVQIAPITLLYQVELNADGEFYQANGVDIANAYLMHLKINRDQSCVSAQSRALLHYFSFLDEIGMQWNEMPIRQNKRPTYRFKRHLETMHRSVDPDSQLRASTCKTYMRCIVNFYKHFLMKNQKFENPPFEHELINVRIDASASSMKASQTVSVHTTDLRIRASDNTSKNNIPNQLMSLSTHEWEQLDIVLRFDRRVIKILDCEEVVIKLPIEFSFVFLLMRYSGLRREEVITLRENHVFNPSKEQLRKGYVNLKIGQFNGVETKYGKIREIEVPTLLLKKLYEYINSPRYIKRREKYEGDKLLTPLFLNTKGSLIVSGTVNARWGEIRKAMEKKLGFKFKHKPHNLRATYAVNRLKALMDSGIPQSDALTFVQSKMGHSNLATTLHYMKQTEQEASGDEVLEHVYDFLFDNNNFDL